MPGRRLPAFVGHCTGMNTFDLQVREMTMSDSFSYAEKSSGSSSWPKLVAIAVIAGVGVLLYRQFGHALNLDYLAAKESTLRAYQADQPVLVFGIAFLIYVTATGLSIPGAGLLSLVYGWYFGWIPGAILVSFASTLGATIAFFLSRYLLRDAIQSKFGERLASFNQNLEKDGAFYLFTLRLIPAVPFFVINVVMGLTPMKARTFLVGQSTRNATWNARLPLRRINVPDPTETCRAWSRRNPDAPVGHCLFDLGHLSFRSPQDL